MEIQAILLLCLEQGELTLKDHTQVFVEITNITHYPGHVPVYLLQGKPQLLNMLSCLGMVPGGILPKFVEWVLVSCNLTFTIGPVEEGFTSPTLDPEPSQPSPHCVECQPKPAVTDEPSPRVAELRMTPEPDPHRSSDQVQELETMHKMVDDTVEIEDAE